MSTEPQPEPAGTRMPNAGAQQQAACPSDQPDASIDTSPSDQAEALAVWTLARLEDLRTVLPGLAAGCGGGNSPAVPR